MTGGFSATFPQPALIGMVHLGPLPGAASPDSMESVIERAVADARAWEAGGAAAILVENFGDAPFFPDSVPPVTIAAIARVLAAVQGAVRLPLGVNVLRNDAAAALGLAAAYDLAMVRINVHIGAAVTDQGLIQGRAAWTIRQRAQLPGSPLILADVRVKHAAPLAPRPLADEVRDLWSRGGADALLHTGAATGAPVDLSELESIAHAVPSAPVLLASGVDPERIATTRGRVAGWIVGSWAKVDGDVAAPVDSRRVAQLAAARDA